MRKKNNEDEEIIVKKRKTKKKIFEETEVEVHKPLVFNLVELVVIVAIVAIVMSVSSALLVYKNYNKIPFKNTTNNKIEKFDELVENYNHIMENYVNEVDGKELIDAAIGGMYNYLGDAYSMYLDVDTTSDLQEQLQGQYEGIGIEITMDEDANIVINRVFSDSPAMDAGLKPGDILLELDGESLKGKDSAYFADTVKNGTKSEHEIVYKRDNKEYKTVIKKKLVSIDSVTSEEYDNVGYLNISTFSGTTAAQVEKKLKAFGTNINSLVIDLRDNTGGYLNSATDISELLLDKGKNIYQLKDRDEKITVYKSQKNPIRKFNKIVVVINGNSASASEILTLALKESAGATVVGVKSYGKGTVQETEILSSGAMVKYTTAYWLSPNGNSINEIGIIPDIEETDPNKMLDVAIKAVK